PLFADAVGDAKPRTEVLAVAENDVVGDAGGDATLYDARVVERADALVAIRPEADHMQVVGSRQEMRFITDAVFEGQVLIDTPGIVEEGAPDLFAHQEFTGAGGELLGSGLAEQEVGIFVA